MAYLGQRYLVTNNTNFLLLAGLLSQVRRVDLDTGEVLQRNGLAARYFGEGIAILNDVVHQLTWQVRSSAAHDVHTLRSSRTACVNCTTVATCRWLTERGVSLCTHVVQGGQGFTYDVSTLAPLSTFTYATSNGEGWGITHNDTHLIVSDGSSFLHFWDPDTHK